jgi:hypothetical protein
MHIAHGKTGRDAAAIVDQRGPFGHRRHALAGGVEAAGRIMRRHARPDDRVRHPGHPEGRGDIFAGDIVMRRPDTAGGENLIVAGTNLVDRADDGFRDIGNDPHFAYRNADIAQALRQKADIRVLRAAGQHLVADDQNAGGGISGSGHARP